MATGKDQNLENFLKNLIEGMRPKLLDLTRRNPLLSTPFSERSHSNLRVVDEVPSFLFEKLLTESMRLIPLPSLEEDPKDELSPEFINAFSLARYSDKEYLETINKIEQEQEDTDQQLITIERELKDRVRAELGMPERQTKTNLSLQQHAKNHHINPTYDLSFDLKDSQAKHIDNDIQTLLLPDQFERRLNAILSKVRTWQQETGISVFHIAFGFLEWSDKNSNKTSFAPLILMPATLEKERKATGVEFYISTEAENPQENVVLSEKLKLDYSIDLPKFNQEQSLDDYLLKIEESIPKHLKWRLRKQVALGVFPSAKMAMYHDLDTNKWNFHDNDIINTLFAGNGCNGVVTSFADDYEVDEPQIESKVPFLITEADSSQFSTLVDLVDNKNLAVEGPPGSGKSQTIVNAIASALHDGKKILFVAEKTAALEVVKSRLEALNLGEFILPLLASRSNRAAVIESLRERIDLGGYHVDNINNIKSAYARYRTQIKEYIEVLGKQYGSTGLTVHDILGQRLKYDVYLQSLPDKLKNYSIPNVDTFTQESIKDLMNSCDELESADIEYSQRTDYWNISKIINLTPFRADNILNHISDCADIFTKNEYYRSKLRNYEMDKSLNANHIDNIINLIELFANNYNKNAAVIVYKLHQDNTNNQLQEYISAVTNYRELKNNLDKIIKNTGDWETLISISNLIELARKYQIHVISINEINKLKSRHEKNVNQIKYLYNFISEVITKAPELQDKTPIKIVELCYIASLASREVLAFRSDLFEDPLFCDYIKKQQKQAQSLKDKKTELSRRIFIDREIDPDNLRLHLNTMTSAGLFRFFNGKYRTAKRFYKAISKEQKYQLDDAVHNLTMLLDFKMKDVEFNNDDNLKKLFKYTYEGIDTDFKLALEAIKFYKNIEDSFQNTEDGVLREFLLHETPNKIKNLPRPDIDKCQDLINYGNQVILKIKLEDLENLSETLDADLKEMHKLHGFFIMEAVSIEQLHELQIMLKQLHNYKKGLENKYIEELLGSDLFDKENTDIYYLQEIIKLYDAFGDLDENIKKPLITLFMNENHRDFEKLLVDIKKSDEECQRILQDVSSVLECEIDDILNSHSRDGIAEWAKSAKDDKDGLMNYSKLASYKKTVSDYGFSNVLEVLSDKKERFKDIKCKIKGLILNNLADSVYRKYGNQLAKYSGLKLNSIRHQFAKNDKAVQALASYYIADRLVQNANPPNGIGRGRKRDWTEYNLINSEISKKQRYISPRDLTNRAGNALLELKPCWMMSPLSVAQYIRKSDIQFDLLIIDEASQMTPENAIGAIARCKQAMIVGDTNQLPPTSFFKKFIAVEEDEDDEDAVTEESILEIANNAFRPARRLRWHYRSRHSSLIAFSNKYIYDNDLTIYPSAYEDNPTMGVSLVKVDGVYSSGSNPNEASKMIEHIVAFMRENQDRSLGVVTVNQKQRDLLLEEFEFALSTKPYLLDYINKWEEKNDGLESFFIKNLENVQGDERDVIFIGTVYGPQSPGAKVMQRFGPINGIAGKRRLNVLFTRAKKQIVTFSSMTSADIVADENSNPGVYLLKQWLEYSATNVLETGINSFREPDSAFEEYVIAQIENMGCHAVPQVGVSGYFVDIGVKHPNWLHGYILGVECDGASYHSSKSARDRDRLREEVLTNLGWNIYRIWSTDWFENPRTEADKLRNKITERLQELKEKECEIYPKTEIIDVEDSTVEEKERAGNARHDTMELFDKASENNDSITESRARTLLIRLRDQDIAEEFEDSITERGILNDNVIGILLAKKPTTSSDFRNCIPLSIRDKIDHRQMIYLNTILDIIRRIR